MGTAISYSSLASEYRTNSTTFIKKEKGPLFPQQTPTIKLISQNKVLYSTKEEDSKLTGKYTRITIRDPSFKRRHRYFFSFVQAIRTMFNRRRRTGSLKTYLSGRTVHLRTRLTTEDRKALACTKVFGTEDSKLLLKSSSESSPYGINSGPTYVATKEDLRGKVTDIINDFNGNLVEKKGFYEIQLSTAIMGTYLTEPHQVSFIIDPFRKQFYLIDSKGTKPEKLAFYDFFNRRPVEINVADFIQSLKSQDHLKDYDLVTTPSFQGAGDCVAVAEAVSRSLAVIRKQLISEERLDDVDKHYEIETAVGMIHENYAQTVTDDIRAELEAEMKKR